MARYKIKVVFIAPTPAPYRAVLYDELEQGCPDYELVAVFQEESFTEMQWADDRPRSIESMSLRPLALGPANRLPMIQRVNVGITKLLNRHSPDVLVTHAFGTVTGRAVCRWAMRHGVPFFLRCDANFSREMEKPPWQRSLRSRSFRWEMRHAAGALTIGTMNEAFYAYHGLQHKRHFRVPFMIDSSRAALLAERERTTGQMRRELGVRSRSTILFVGRLVDGKGLAELLRAYLSLLKGQHLDADLILVGSGPLEWALRAKAGDLLGSRIHMPGFLQPDDVFRCMGIADVLVAASHADAWGMVLNEAMAAGVPVVATAAVGAAKDLLVDGVNGRIVPRNDPNALAACLANLLSEPEGLREMGRAAQKGYAEWAVASNPVDGFRKAIDSAAR